MDNLKVDSRLNAKAPPPGFEPVKRATIKKKSHAVLDEKFKNLKMYFKKDKTTNPLTPLPRPKNHWNINKEMDVYPENSSQNVLTIDFIKNQYAACSDFSGLEILHENLIKAFTRESAQILKHEKEIEEVEQTLKFDKVNIKKNHLNPFLRSF
jgi:hypothetical protein